MGASHYGRRSRDNRFSPIILQETKNSTSRPFTLEVRFKVRRSPKCLNGNIFLTKATDSQREFGLDKNGNPNYGREAVGFFHKKLKK